MELLQGAHDRDEIRVIKRFLIDQRFRILPVSEAVSHRPLHLIEQHSLSHGLRPADALIAATARENAAMLVRANARHFNAGPGLETKTFRPSRTN